MGEEYLAAASAALAAPQVSNSLRVPLTGKSAAVNVLKKLEAFGELARADMLEGAVVASYFDVRAAWQAKEAFGLGCDEEAQFGSRRVRLPGGHFLDRAVVPEVSKIEPCADGSFLVEFFDTRMAATMAGSMAEQSAGQGSKAAEGSSETSTDDANAKPKERAGNLLSEEVKWDKLRGGREKRTVLLLRGMPRSLCDRAAVEALLERSGLLKGVESVAARPASGKIGCVMLRARTVEHVPALIKFFHGQQFSNGPPVAVSYAPVQFQDKRPCKGAADSTATSSTASSWSRGTSPASDACQEPSVTNPVKISPPPGLESLARLSLN